MSPFGINLVILPTKVAGGIFYPAADESID